VSPLVGEPTNILIELTGTTPLAVTTFGYPRSLSRRFIALYVDQPGAFAEAVTRAIGDGVRAAIA
jgi:catechol 2,3-dioxygenase-like lactoylglutathione lyase family enzyme